MQEAEKECIRCKLSLPLSSFHKDKGRPDGHTYYCKKCASDKSRETYERNKEGVLAKTKAYYHANKDERRACYKVWKEKNRDRVRQIDKEGHLKRRFGLTIETFNELLLQQENKCAVCRKPEPRGRRNIWQVDHDHSCCSGKKTCGKCVRGLLCYACNVGLGFFDSLEDLEAAVSYIKQHSKNRKETK